MIEIEERAQEEIKNILQDVSEGKTTLDLEKRKRGIL
jgi:hypothetical protein